MLETITMLRQKKKTALCCNLVLYVTVLYVNYISLKWKNPAWENVQDKILSE